MVNCMDSQILKADEEYIVSKTRHHMSLLLKDQQAVASCMVVQLLVVKRCIYAQENRVSEHL